MHYDNPNFLVIRQQAAAGALSATAASTAFVGTTLRVYTKAAVLGVTIVMGSGASVGGNNTLAICRIVGTGTTASIFQAQTCTISKTTSAAGEVFDISLTTPMTLGSIGDKAVVAAGAATLADVGGVISDVIWRYRILPKLTEKNETQ